MAAEDPTRPSVEDVSLLLRTRTVGGVFTGLGADTGPGDVTVFDETTRPTAAEVEKLITTAHGAMEGRLDGVLLEDQVEEFSHVVALYTAYLITVSYFRESADATLLDLWNSLIGDNLTAINKKIDREAGVDPDAPSYGFGSLVVTSDRPHPAVPPADVVPGIDA
jgi:hypothetical protein